MTNRKDGENATEKVPQGGNAHPDSKGWIQNHTDSSGFAPGKEPKKPDGKWHSTFPDAHGWRHSSTK